MSLSKVQCGENILPKVQVCEKMDKNNEWGVSMRLRSKRVQHFILILD